MQPDSFSEMLDHAEGGRIDLHRMPPEGRKAAHEIYAACVNFCQRADLPYSAIRVSIFAWGDPAPKKQHKGLATTLHFRQGTWWAALEPRTQVTSPYASGFGELWLDHRPAKMLRASKRRGQDQYLVRVATWLGGQGIGEGKLGLFDPWTKTVSQERGPKTLVLPANTVRASLSIRRIVTPSDTLAGPVELYLGDGNTGWFAKLDKEESIQIDNLAFVGPISACLVGGKEATLFITEQTFDRTCTSHFVRVPGA